jgi:hypothetical protein
MLSSLIIYLGYTILKNTVNKDEYGRDLADNKKRMKEVGYNFTKFHITIDDIKKTPINVVPWFVKIY